MCVICASSVVSIGGAAVMVKVAYDVISLHIRNHFRLYNQELTALKNEDITDE